MVSLLNNLPGVSCDTPGGAFYAFPDFSTYIGQSFRGEEIKDSFALSDVILNEAKVVTIPGDGFGAPGHIRFSYPLGEDEIEEGIKKLLYDEDFKKELQANAKNFLNQYMKFQGESSRKLAEELNNF